MYLNNDDHHQIYHGYILSWTLKPVKKTKSKSNDYRSYLTLMFSSSLALWRGKSLTWFNVPKQWSMITKFLSHIAPHNHWKLSKKSNPKSNYYGRYVTDNWLISDWSLFRYIKLPR